MEVYYPIARIKKDKQYDGKFFFAVKTTGIFCRPSCPSPTAKEENVVYFSTIFEALENGFRPCRRCRPDIEVDYYNGNVVGTLIVRDALQKIYNGYLCYHSVDNLAGELGVSDRHFRQLFIDNLGVPPIKVGQYHKALFAKKLLLYSNQTITDVAFTSGFKSIRQFNDVIKKIFGLTPTNIRSNSKQIHSGDSTGLMLPYGKQFDFRSVLDFMAPRLITGVEKIKDNIYYRTFSFENAKGYFSVCNCPDISALKLRIECNDIRCYMEIYNRVRRMFDLKTDFESIYRHFKTCPKLVDGMTEGQVPALPVAFDPFEFIVRAILGQQVSVKAASTLAARIVIKAGERTGNSMGLGLEYFFPTPKTLERLSLEGLGITKNRQSTIKSVTGAVLNGNLKLHFNQSFEQFKDSFIKIKGIGDWTVNYVAMRALGMPDAFPASDLGIIKALSGNGKKLMPKEILKQSQQWRPYRSYAALCLWNLIQQGG